MDKGKFYSGIAIMVGLIILGVMIPTAVDKCMSYTRTVDVKGLCEKEVKADKVIWPISYKVMGEDLQNIYNQINQKNEILINFLKEGGITEDEISISSPSISDKLANEYGNNDRLYRYVTTNVITVCTKNVDKVLALMKTQSSLMKKGITISDNNWENPIEFKFEGLNELKPEMVEEATKNARETAEKFAIDSDSKLGKIKYASQGTFTINNRDSNTPEIKTVRVVTYVTYYLSE